VPDDVTKILVGNKCDLNPKQISALEGKAVFIFVVINKINVVNNIYIFKKILNI